MEEHDQETQVLTLEEDLLNSEESLRTPQLEIENREKIIEALESLKTSIESNNLVSRGVISQYLNIAGDDAVPLSLESFSTLPSNVNLKKSVESIQASIESNKLALVLAIAAVAVGVILLIRKLLIHLRNRKTDIGKSTKRLIDEHKEWMKEEAAADKEEIRNNDDTKKRAYRAAQYEIYTELQKEPEKRNKHMKMISDKYTLLVEHIFVDNHEGILSRLTSVHNNFREFSSYLNQICLGVEHLLNIYREVYGEVDLNAADSTNAIMDDLEAINSNFKTRQITALDEATNDLFQLSRKPAEFTIEKLNKLEDNLTSSSNLYFIDRLESFGVVGVDKTSTKISDATANYCINQLEEIKRIKETHVGEADLFFSRFNSIVESLEKAVRQYERLLTLFVRVADEYLLFITAIGALYNIRKSLYKKFIVKIKAEGKNPDDQKLYNYKDI